MYAKSLMKVEGLTVSEAMPSALEKADGWYRWEIVIRSGRAAEISRAWKWIRSVRPAPKNLQIAIDLDAYNLL